MSFSTCQSLTETTIKHSLNNINDSLQQLKKRLQNEVLLDSLFVINQKIGNYTFDFFAPSLKLAIQIDAYSYSYANIYNYEKMKVMSISHKEINVLKVSDYQILMDCDEIIRYIKNYYKMMELKN